MSTKDLIISDNYMTEFEVAENGAVIIRQVDALTLTPNTVALSAADLARLLALLAPEPDASNAEIEAGARAIYDVTWNDDAWHLQDEYYRKSLRQRSKAVLLAARAARQTGGSEQ